MDNSQKLVVGIVALIVVLVLVNGFFLLGLQKTGPSKKPSESAAFETKTELIVIVSNNCEKCVDLSGLLDQIRQLDINFSQRQLVFETDAEAKQLVQKYGIQKLPGLLIKASPTDFALLAPRWPALGTAEDANVLVLRQAPPPYFDLASSSTKGLVEFWSIAKTSCADCMPPPASAALEQLGISFSQTHLLDDASPEAQQLVSQYKITKLPTVILSSDVKEYASVASVLQAGGDFAPDGKWVLRNPAPYYWDLSQNRKVGALSLTRLTFKDCNGCFELGQLEAFLTQTLSLKIASDQNLDWSTSEGKQFAKDHNISFLPTLVLGGELEAYQGLKDGWSSFGFVAPDGKLVFAEHPKLGSQFKYFDLDKNELATPEPQSVPNSQQVGG